MVWRCRVQRCKWCKRCAEVVQVVQVVQRWCRGGAELQVKVQSCR